MIFQIFLLYVPSDGCLGYAFLSCILRMSGRLTRRLSTSSSPAHPQPPLLQLVLLLIAVSLDPSEAFLYHGHTLTSYRPTTTATSLKSQSSTTASISPHHLFFQWFQGDFDNLQQVSDDFPGYFLHEQITITKSSPIALCCRLLM